jgi:HPt (histidine-containing phosphotransfer) domain-containing protein
MMPEMDGVETSKVIRDMGIKVPLVALTANAIEGAREMFLAAGLNDYLTKPINKSELRHILEKWLPEEKIIHPLPEAVAAEETDAEEVKDFWRNIEQIDDLSVRAGLNNVSGQRDVYEKSLRLTIKEIERCNRQLSDFLSSADMHKFSIELHSIKSSLANIGAMELSAQARDLETAAVKQDAGYCASFFPPFLGMLNMFNRKLADAFANTGQDAGALPEELPEVFGILADALNRSDFAAIDDAVERLNVMDFRGAAKTAVEDIKDAIMLMDYDSAIDKMQDLFRNQPESNVRGSRTSPIIQGEGV